MWKRLLQNEACRALIDRNIENQVWTSDKRAQFDQGILREVKGHSKLVRVLASDCTRVLPVHYSGEGLWFRVIGPHVTLSESC